MTTRRLLILSLAAVAALAAGLWFARQPSAPSGARALLYPDLARQLDSVRIVRIVKAGDATAVELVRGESGWTVSERAGYAADPGRVGRLLRILADAKVIEEKTSTPARYSSLGVEDISDPAATGVRVELDGLPTAVALIVGKSATGADSTYVRRAGEAQSWLVSGGIDASAAPDAWLRKEVLDISADRIQSASVAVGRGKPYTAAKNARADLNFSVTGLPGGRKPGSPGAANGFATALVGLTLTDVTPAKKLEASPPAARATYATFDGLILRLDGWSSDGRHFITVQPTFDAALAERFRVAATPATAGKDASGEKAAGAATPADGSANPEAKPPNPPNVEDEARTAQARFSGWAYEIPSYKYEQIFKPADQLR